MVRGNWQRRVEQANERKASNSKQRKQRIKQVHALVARRSNNGVEGEVQEQATLFVRPTDENEHLVQKYCKKFFFKGECRSRKKCRFSHKESLLDFLGEEQNDNCDKSSDNCSYNAAVEAMKRFSSAIVRDHQDKSPSDDPFIALQCLRCEGNELSKILKKSVEYEDLVYILMGGELLFDKCWGGIVSDDEVDNSKDDSTLLNKDGRPRIEKLDPELERKIYSSQTSSPDPTVDINAVATNLNATILELFLYHLPESYISVLSLVCSQWANEIRQDLSECFWKSLICNHGFPQLPELSDDISRENYHLHIEASNALERPNDKENGLLSYSSYSSKMHKEYYTSIKRSRSFLLSIQATMRELIDPKSRLPYDFEFDSDNVVAQNYKSTNGAPLTTEDNACVKLKILVDCSTSSSIRRQNADELICSTYSIFVAHKVEASLRIFQIMPDIRKRGTTIRQISCVRALPISKGGVTLDGVEDDDKWIFCIGYKNSTEETVFSILSKNEVKNGEGGVNKNGSPDSESYHVLISNHLILEYCDLHGIELENQLNTLSLVEGSLVSCCDGKFFFRLESKHRVFKIVNAESTDNNRSHLFCLFSVVKREFIWIREYTFQDRLSFELTRKHSCSLFHKKDTDHVLYSPSVDKEFFRLTAIRFKHGKSPPNEAPRIYMEVIEETPLSELNRSDNSHHIVCSLVKYQSGFSTITHSVGGNDKDIHSLVRFYELTPLPEMDFLPPFESLFEGKVSNVSNIGNRMLAVLHHVGHGVCASIISTLSQQVVSSFQLCQLDDHFRCNFAHDIDRNGGDVLAFEYKNQALIVTGESVGITFNESASRGGKFSGETTPRSCKKSKKKNKRLASKTGKKDGFARGMTLRG